MNTFTISGRLTKDPELKKTTSGLSVCYFTLAVNKQYQVADGEDKADFLDFQAWRQSADFLCKYCSKGDMVGVTGSISTYFKQRQDGTNEKIIQLKADRLEKLSTGSKKADTGTSETGGINTSQPSQNASEAKYGADTGNFSDVVDIASDDLPF